jgi:hypothetical protein
MQDGLLQCPLTDIVTWIMHNQRFGSWSLLSDAMRQSGFLQLHLPSKSLFPLSPALKL